MKGLSCLLSAPGGFTTGQTLISPFMHNVMLNFLILCIYTVDRAELKEMSVVFDIKSEESANVSFAITNIVLSSPDIFSSILSISVR